MKRILLIDDNNIFRFTVKKMFSLAAFGGELHEFESAQKALDALNQAAEQSDSLPDLILLDINMPDMNGFQFLSALSQQPAPLSELKVQILSSSIDAADRAKAAEFKQVTGFISKPLYPEVVNNIIASL